MAPVKARLAGNGYPPAKSRNAGTRHALVSSRLFFKEGLPCVRLQAALSIFAAENACCSSASISCCKRTHGI